MKSKCFEISDNAEFLTYEKTAKKRFAFHNFTRAFRLKNDSNRQKIWKIWIEYLNFEYWKSNRLADLMKISKFCYRNVWNDFQRFDTSHYSSLKKMIMFFSKVNFSNISNFEQRLNTTQAELEILWQKICVFFQSTEFYRRKKKALRRQNIFTSWIRKQFHLIDIEIETAQKNKITNDNETQMIFNKKKTNREWKNQNQKHSIEFKFKKSRQNNVSKKI